MNVLFVCLGNICRSTMAEGIFKHKINQLGLSHITADSAGTGAWHIGSNPDNRTMETLQKHGIRYTHKGRQVVADDAASFDFILAMDQSNYNDLIEILPNDYNNLHMIREFDPEGHGDVPDPYYGGQSGFDNVYTLLERSIDAFIEKHIQHES
ncbi:MAG: low molecular weight phosphotyrosine protein phosphatase [Cyclobacteriaceae bacterium]